jgi:hypothetical protein
MLGLDAVQAWVSISDIGRLIKVIRVLQSKIPVEHPMKTASFIEIALQIIKEDSQARAHLSLRRYRTALSVLKSPFKSDGSDGSNVSSTEVTAMASRRVISVTTTNAELPVAAVETFTPLHQEESLQQSSLLGHVFTPRERHQFVQRTAQVLFTTEFVILVEYTEVIVPFIFCTCRFLYHAVDYY